MASDQATTFRENPSDTSFLGAARTFVAATRDDAVNEPDGISRGLYLDSTGAVKVTTAKGDDITLAGLAVGVIHPLGCQRVWDNGTTVAAGDVYLVY